MPSSPYMPPPRPPTTLADFALLSRKSHMADALDACKRGLAASNTHQLADAIRSAESFLALAKGLSE